MRSHGLLGFLLLKQKRICAVLFDANGIDAKLQSFFL